MRFAVYKYILTCLLTISDNRPVGIAFHLVALGFVDICLACKPIVHT